jgi:hypothetical protein
MTRRLVSITVANGKAFSVVTGTLVEQQDDIEKVLPPLNIAVNM